MKYLLIALCVLFVSFSALASTSSILIDAKTGAVLSAQNADEERYPASLTKLMNLYIVFDALDKGLLKMNDELVVSRNAANKSPSKLGLKAGEKIRVEDAVMAVIVKSANDAAAVLAEAIGYSEDNYAKTMTEVAHALGMKNTTFKNASGLPHKSQKTTARDMALLGAAMYHHFPQYYPLFATQKFSYNGRTYYTHNHLLRKFAGADGLKTGFTNAAGYNIVTSAERGGKRVIAVTMGHDSAKIRDTKVANLMNKGLKNITIVPEKIIMPQSSETLASSEDEVVSEAAVFGIQIGAFSNYAKARNYALKINSEIKKKNTNINIEAVETQSAIIYRSKIIGFAKNDAQKACNYLKKSNKSCIVVSVNNKQELVLAQHHAR